MFKKVYLILTIVLLIFSCSEKNTLEDDHSHTEAIGLIIYYNEKPFFKILNAKIDETIAKEFALNRDEEKVFRVAFIDDDNEEFVPDEPNKNFSWIIDDTSLVQASLLPNEKYKFKMRGLKSGATQIEFRLNHNDHPDFKTPKIPLVVK